MADLDFKNSATDAKKFELPNEDVSFPESSGIGLVAPFDFALDAECWRWLPEDTPLYVTRTPSIENTAVTVDLAKEVSDAQSVTTAVKSLLAVKPASIGYACTSGSFVGGKSGEEQLQKTMIDAGASEAVTTSGALVLALEQLHIKKLAVATPYNQTLSSMLDYFLQDHQFEVVSNGYLDKEEGIAKINYDTVKALARYVNTPDAEAIFFSCTNLRTFDIIAELEEELGKPILSANQVTIWASLKIGGLKTPKLNQTLFT